MRYILAATKDREAAAVVRSALRRSFHVDEASTIQDGVDLHRKRRYEFIFIDLDMVGERVGGDGSFWRLRQTFPSAEAIVMAPPERIREAVEAVKAGAANYVTYPLNID